MFSGRGLCDELITRPEESYRLWCVVVCDLETSRMGAPFIYDISRLRVNINRYCRRMVVNSHTYYRMVVNLRICCRMIVNFYTYYLAFVNIVMTSRVH